MPSSFKANVTVLGPAASAASRHSPCRSIHRRFQKRHGRAFSIEFGFDADRECELIPDMAKRQPVDHGNAEVTEAVLDDLNDGRRRLLLRGDTSGENTH